MAAAIAYLVLFLASYQTYQHEQNKLYEYEVVFNNGTKVSSIYTNARSLNDWLCNVFKRHKLLDPKDRKNLQLQYYDQKSDRMIIYEKKPEPLGYLDVTC